MAPTPKQFNSIYSLVAIAVLGVIVAIAAIVADKFWVYIAGYWGLNYVVVEDTCYLGDRGNSTNLCYFNWSMVAITGFFMLFVFFMATCNRRPGVATPFLMGFLLATGMFATLAGYNQKYIPPANQQAAAAAANQVPPEEDKLHDWRNAVLGLSWTGFALSLLGLICAATDMVKNKGVAPPQDAFMVGGGAPPPGAYAPPPPGYGGPLPGYAPPPGAYGAPPPAYGAPPPGYGVPPPADGYNAPPVYDQSAGYKPASDPVAAPAMPPAGAAAGGPPTYV